MKKRIIIFLLLLCQGLWPGSATAQLQTFGIFSPTMGLMESMPSITMAEAFTHDNENVLLRYGEIQRCKMRSDQCQDASNDSIQTPDTNPVLTYHYFEQADETDYLLAFTKAHIYHWDTVGVEWDLKFTCSSDCDTWSIVTYNDVCYATNDVDKVQKWNGSWDTFRNLETVKYSTGKLTVVNGDKTLEGDGDVDWTTGSVDTGDLIYISGSNVPYVVDGAITDANSLEMTVAWAGSGASELTYVMLEDVGIDIGSVYLTAAKFLTTFEGYLMAWNVTAGGSAYPQTGYWCDTQDADTWDSGNAGDMALPGPEAVRGYGKVAEFLLIFSGRSIDQMWATDSSLIFNARRLRNNMGTYSPDSIINGVNGELFFLDNRKNMRVIRSVMSDMLVISKPVDPTVKSITDSLVSDVRSCWVDSLDQIWWAIPYGPDATANNKILCLDINGAWTKRDVAVSAFGEYIEKTTYTIDTIPFDTIDEIGWDTIDSVEANADYRLDICSDFSGYHFNSHNSEEDAGSDFTGYAVIGSDLSGQKGVGADRYKRLDFVSAIFRNEEGGTATIEIKRDFENSWQTMGDVSLDGSGEIIWKKINCDYRARYFQVKVSATNSFRFVGLIFYYTTEGLR